MDTWLTPACSAWDARYGVGTYKTVVKQFARYFEPLADHYTPEVIGAHLAQYLRVTPSQFVNIARFAMTFGDWAPVEPRVVEPPRERGKIVDGWMDDVLERLTRP